MAVESKTNRSCNHNNKPQLQLGDDGALAACERVAVRRGQPEQISGRRARQRGDDAVRRLAGDDAWTVARPRPRYPLLQVCCCSHCIAYCTTALIRPPHTNQVAARGFSPPGAKVRGAAPPTGNTHPSAQNKSKININLR